MLTAASGCSVVTTFDGYVDASSTAVNDVAAQDTPSSGEEDTALDEDSAVVEDTLVADTRLVDSFVPDTSKPDTFVADTAPPDTSCSADNRKSCGVTCTDCIATLGPLGRCEAGTCKCPSDASYCLGKCTRLATDPLHCGTCAATTSVVDGSQWCVGGMPQCKPGLNVCKEWDYPPESLTMLCPAACVDVTSEGNHCYVSQTSWARCWKGSAVGLCINRSCETKSATVTCGTRLECPVVTSPTDPDVRGCLDGQRDPNHCGACNVKCAKDQICAQGSCKTYVAAKSTADCPPEWSYCTVSGWPFPVCVMGATCPT